MFREGINIITALLVGWFVLSFMGFLLIGWSYLQNNVYQSGLQTGLENGANQASAQIYTDIINKAANDQCNTVFIQFDGRRVDLINVQCLQAVGQPELQDAGDPDENRG
ncbi:MAG: hypothetical protein ACON4G_08385 [Candidatus Puniceispirillaceae bacterium]